MFGFSEQIAEETKTKVKKPDEVVDEEEVFVLNGQAAFARWCLAWMLVQPVSMFHTILMTAAYTVDDLRRELLPVIRFASRVQACFSLEGVQTALVVAKKEECTEDIAKQAMDVIGGHYRQGDVAADATPSFVVFLDEVNTSSILGSVQDVMLDNSLEGEPLPHNIFWVCATNPFRAETAVIDQHSAASGDVGFRAHYQVSFALSSTCCVWFRFVSCKCGL